MDDEDDQGSFDRSGDEEEAEEEDGSGQSASSSSSPSHPEPLLAATDVASPSSSDSDGYLPAASEPCDSNEPSGAPEPGQSSLLSPEMTTFSKCAKCEKTVSFGEGRLLDCFHVACTACIKDRLRHDLTLVCPKCFQRTSVRQHFADLPQDRFPTVGLAFKQPDDPREPPSGEICVDCMDLESIEEAATYWCTDCQGMFCEDHSRQHLKRRASKTHKLNELKRQAGDGIDPSPVPKPPPAATATRDPAGSIAPFRHSADDLGDLLVMDFTSTCSIHPKEQLRYCPECGALLCAVCQETGGCTHDTVDGAEAVKHCLPELAALVKSPDSESEQATPGQREALSAVEKQIRSIDDDVSRISEAVTTTFDKYQKAVESKMKEILKDLDEIKWKNRIPLEEQRQRLQDLRDLQTRAYQFSSMFKQPANSLDPLVMLRMGSALMHVARTTSQTYAEEPKRQPRLAFIQRDQEQLFTKLWSLIKTMGYAADLATYPAHFNTKLTFLQEAKHVGEEAVVRIKTVDDKDRPVEIGSHGNKAEDWRVSFNFPEEQHQGTVAGDDPCYPGLLVSRFRNQRSPGIFSVTAMYKMNSVQSSLKGELRPNFRFDPKKSSKLLEISEDGYKVTYNTESENVDVYAIGSSSYPSGSREWTVGVCVPTSQQTGALFQQRDHLGGVHLGGVHLGGVHLDADPLSGVHLSGDHLGGVTVPMPLKRSNGTLSLGVADGDGFTSAHIPQHHRHPELLYTWALHPCKEGFTIRLYAPTYRSDYRRSRADREVIATCVCSGKGPFSPAVKFEGGPLSISCR